MAMKINTIKQEERNKVEEKGKVIRRAQIARQILHEGGDNVRIIDIKASRENPDRTCFVFRNDEAFQSVFEKVLSNNADRKAVVDDNVVALKAQMQELQERLNRLTSAVDDVKED